MVNNGTYITIIGQLPPLPLPLLLLLLLLLLLPPLLPPSLPCCVCYSTLLRLALTAALVAPRTCCRCGAGL